MREIHPDGCRLLTYESLSLEQANTEFSRLFSELYMMLITAHQGVFQSTKKHYHSSEVVGNLMLLKDYNDAPEGSTLKKISPMLDFLHELQLVYAKVEDVLLQHELQFAHKLLYPELRDWNNGQWISDSFLILLKEFESLSSSTTKEIDKTRIKQERKAFIRSRMLERKGLGVYSTNDLFSHSFNTKLCEEIQNLRKTSILASVDETGISLFSLGYRPFFQSFTDQLISPLSKAYMENSSLSCSHSSAIYYDIRPLSEGHMLHVDNSNLTLNHCLGVPGFLGGQLNLYTIKSRKTNKLDSTIPLGGPMINQVSPQPNQIPPFIMAPIRPGQTVHQKLIQKYNELTCEQIPGSTLIHPGDMVHGSQGLSSGTRCNLVIWFDQKLNEPFPFLELPPMVQWSVCCFLKVSDLCALSCTCKALKAATYDEETSKNLWKYFFDATFPDDNNKETNQQVTPLPTGTNQPNDDDLVKLFKQNEQWKLALKTKLSTRRSVRYPPPISMMSKMASPKALLNPWQPTFQSPRHEDMLESAQERLNSGLCHLQ